ncbi:MAG TPA: flagellar export protein FliJ [Pseudogracilibacillus sp.]|nr:flagellar export protein FliJ [Pseudogracilibacillus sp.]
MADTAVLEKILHVKEKEKDAAQLDKTEAVNRFEEIASRLYEELKRKENAESELDVVMKAKATITMIKEQSRYISLMKEKINTLQNNVQKARIEMEQKQNALTEAHIEVKKIERLIALREQEQKELLQKQEMAFMDEISMLQFQKQRQNR